VTKVRFPKYIQEAFIKSANYHQKARHTQSIFENWISENYGEEVIEHDGVRDTIIDAIEQSNNPYEAMERIKEIIETEYSIQGGDTK
jgi:hypothetical protein